MADSKITALTAISTVDPTADPLVIVDVSDTSMAASGTTKKSTINQLLGAGGTATLASATITGDLTVDTSTLKVDSANNRVGVLTASPAQALDVASGNLQVRTGGTVFSDTFSNYGAALQINAAGSLPLRLQISGSNAYEITSANVHTWQNVGGVAGTAMTLNSSGLFLGISSQAFAEKFRVYGSYTLMDDGAFTGFLGKASSLGVSGATTDFGIRSSNALIFLSGGATERMRIDSSGNVGIGVTPSYLLHTAVASGANRNIARFQVTGASNGLTITWNHATTKMIVNFSNLPTSSAGLASGDLWIDTTAGNTLKVA